MVRKNLSIRKIVLWTGLSTFIFGFAAGAAYNWYLIQIDDPLVEGLRASLSFKSAIYGDGIILPLINMVAMLFILKNRKFIDDFVKFSSVAGASGITAYFHLTQAVKGLVNWAMPEPWMWNALGLWHAVYMFSVSYLLTFFYLLAVRKLFKKTGFPFSLVVVTAGLIIFFFLLDLDYK